MKLLLILSVVGVALAQRNLQQQYNSLNNVPILAYNNDINPDGSFRYNYETGNGIRANAEGFLRNPGNKDLEAQVMTGSYSYTGPDGVVYTVNWTADENGYRAEGAHLPTPPPIPDAIQRSLQFQNNPRPQNNRRF